MDYLFLNQKIEFRADLHLHLSITQKLFIKLNSDAEGSKYMIVSNIY